MSFPTGIRTTPNNLLKEPLIEWLNYAELRIGSLPSTGPGDVSSSGPRTVGSLTKWISGTPAVAATGILTISTNPADGDILGINGVAFTYRTSSPGANEIQIGASSTVTATNTSTVLNASTDPLVNVATYTHPSATIVITYDISGVIGNSFTLSSSTSNITLSDLTLTGGADLIPPPLASATLGTDYLAPAMTTLGDMMYGGTSGLLTRLSGNTSTTKKFLSQTGTGSSSAAPVWGQPASTDLSDSSNIPLLNAANVFSNNNQFSAIGIAVAPELAHTTTAAYLKIVKTGINLGTDTANGIYVDLQGGTSPGGEHMTGVYSRVKATADSLFTGGPISFNGFTWLASGITTTSSWGINNTTQIDGATGIAYAAANQIQVIGGSITNTAYGEWIDILTTGTIANATGIHIQIRKLSSGSFTTAVKGIELSSWSGTPTTSYGIYADTSIDIGTTKYFIYSLSVSPSLLTGDLTISGLLKAGSTPTTLTDSAGKILSAALNTVAVSQGGTGFTSYTIGDILYASGSTTLSKLIDVMAGSYLRSGGTSTAPVWSTTTLPNSATTGDLLYASASNVYSNLADIATGNALISGGVGVIMSWGKIGLTTHVSGTLGVANGGTGTATTFTQGSVVFAGASGIYTQDNTNFFWDATNHRLGIGNASPGQSLEVSGNIFLNTSTANLYLKDTSTGWQSASTTIVTPQSNNSIRSTAFTSGLIGWNINASGSAEFDNVDIRGAIHAGVFVYNALSVTAGTQVIAPSGGKLKTDVTVTASPTYGTTTFTIEIVDQDGLTHAASQLFAVNDILRLKDGLVGDTWFKVTAVSDQTTFWRYTASIQAGTSNVTYRSGLGVPDYGISGKGFIILTADQTNSPYMQMATHAGTFSSSDASGTLNITPQLRIGNLNGSYGYGSDIYGLGAGQYGASSKSWITIDQTSGIRIGNNTTQLAQWDISGNILVGQASTAAQSSLLITSGRIDLRNGSSNTVMIRLASDGSGYLANTSIAWDTAGNLTMTGNAVIGGVTIGSGKMYIGTGTYNNTNTAFYVDSTGQFSLKDKLVWNGSALTISGTVTATAGTIGGWTISATKLANGTVELDSSAGSLFFKNSVFGNQGIQLQYNGGTPRTYIGDGANQFLQFDGTNVSWKGTNTSLTAAGAFTATNATITGTITSGAGAIGGWTLSTTSLSAGSGGTTVAMDSGGTNPAFYAGNAIPGSAPFRVTNAGALTATNATITGAITATSGAIGGWTVSATRISSTNIFIDQAGQYISMGATPPTAYGNNVGLFLEGANSGRMSLYKDADNYLQWTNAVLNMAGSLRLSGSASNIAVGSTPPTSASAGTGIWIDRTGLFGLLSNVVQAKLDATTGAITAGTGNVSLSSDGLTFLHGSTPWIWWKDPSSPSEVQTLVSVNRSSSIKTMTVKAGTITANTSDLTQLSLQANNSSVNGSAITLLSYGSAYATPAQQSQNYIWLQTLNGVILSNAIGWPNTTGVPNTILDVEYFSNSDTNTIRDLLTLRHSGSTTNPASGFGGGLLFTLSPTTFSFGLQWQNAVRLAAIWTTATTASMTSAFVIQTVNNAGSLGEVARFAGNGDFTLTGVIKAGSGPTTLTDAAGKILSAALNTVSPGVGGTGLTSYAVGDILYASGSTTFSKLSAVATGNVLISGGVTTAPSWGKITDAHIDTTSTPQFARLGAGQAADGTGLIALTGHGDSFKFNIDDFTSYTQYAFYESGTKVAALSYAGSTSSGFIGGAGALAFGTIPSKPIALFTNANARITIDGSGNIKFNAYGAGALSTDSSGNITASDGRLKDIQGPFKSGLSEILKLNSIIYKWKPETIFDRDTNGEYKGTLHAGFIAQEVGNIIPLALGKGVGIYYNYDDRTIIAALVNAIKDLNKMIKDQQIEIKTLKTSID